MTIQTRLIAFKSSFREVPLNILYFILLKVIFFLNLTSFLFAQIFIRGLPGMPGLSMYDPEDLKNMRDEMGIDQKTIDEYREKYGKAESGENKDTATEQKQTKTEDPGKPQNANLGFFDTVKAAGENIYGKIKSVLPGPDKEKEKTDL